VRPEHDLAIREVAVAGDVARLTRELLLVVALDAVLSLAVVVDKAEQVRGEARALDPGKVRALLLLLKADAWEQHRLELVGLVFGEAARDVGEFGA